MVNIIIGLIIALGAITAIYKLIKLKREGKSSCSHACGGCPFSDGCRKKEKEEEKNK